jgi:hypothetical protein
MRSGYQVGAGHGNRSAACAWAGAMALVALACGVAQAAPQAPRELLVQVRDTPPEAGGGYTRGPDNSVTVSTGGGGNLDSASDSGPNGATTVSTSNSVRNFRIHEGERVRIDLPAVQALQFRVPMNAAGSSGASTAGASGTKSSSAAGASAPASNATGARSGGSVSGVVYFDAVAAFAARMSLAGTTVRIELTPLKSGTVAAPVVGAPDAPHTVVITGHTGQWIALGDTDTAQGMRSLSPTPDPPSPASVWVRVYPAPEERP